MPAMSAADEPVINLHYGDRPPYLVTQDDNQVTGLSGTPITNAFVRSGIPFRWVATPISRAAEILKESSGADCIANLYKTPAREAWANFTLPVIFDGRYVLMANQSFKAEPGATLAEILSRKDIRVYVKQDTSYGAYVDGLINKLDPRRFSTTQSTSAMLAFIREGRADFMFATETEAAFYLTHDGGKEARGLKVINLPDTPPGEARYILCAKSVPESVINRLNQAIGRH
jgi:uncharacterized protein (TIGR02285 family)